MKELNKKTETKEKSLPLKVLNVVLQVLKWWAFWPVLIPYYILKVVYDKSGILGVLSFIAAILCIFMGIKGLSI